MNIHDGKIGFTRDELEGLKARGFNVDEHTPYYMNGITATYGDVTAGLYCWLDGLSAYLGETEVPINTEEQAKCFLAVMDSLVNLQKLYDKFGYSLV